MVADPGSRALGGYRARLFCQSVWQAERARANRVCHFAAVTGGPAISREAMERGVWQETHSWEDGTYSLEDLTAYLLVEYDAGPGIFEPAWLFGGAVAAVLVGLLLLKAEQE
jgi:hypothetical protein